MRSSIFNTVKVVALLSLLLLGACAGSSSYMRDVAPEKANYTTQPDKALVVFMRPSGLGFAVQSTVFDITDGNPVFLGIVSAKTKIAHYARPGKRRYMVIGESADFMGATLDSGKVYYSLVTPRMGLWKARFSLRPVRRADLGTAEFAGWYNDTRWVENLASALNWAKLNKSDIREKMTEYLPEWQQKSDKPLLASEDGQVSLYLSSATNRPVTH